MQKISLLMACAVLAIVVFVSPFQPLAASGTIAPVHSPSFSLPDVLPYLMWTVRVGVHRKGVAINPDDDMIYTVLVDNSQIVKIYGGNNNVQSSEPTGCSHPNQVFYNPGFKRLYVTNRDSDTMTF